MESAPVRPPTTQMGRESVLRARPEQPLRDAVAVIRDVLEMAKGRITVFVAFTAAMGLWLAPAGLGATRSNIAGAPEFERLADDPRFRALLELAS